MMAEPYLATTADLKTYPHNSRTHSRSQVQQIAKSIEQFGFTNPILITPERMVIAGHGRLLAARLLDLNTVPCLILSGLTEEQISAYVIADNKLALNAGWDEAMLRGEIDMLQGLDFDLTLLGFDDGELQKILDAGHEISASGGEGQSGAQENFLRFGDKRVPLTPKEALALGAALDAYVEEFGLANGFVRKLLGEPFDFAALQRLRKM